MGLHNLPEYQDDPAPHRSSRRSGSRAGGYTANEPWNEMVRLSSGGRLCSTSLYRRSLIGADVSA